MSASPLGLTHTQSHHDVHRASSASSPPPLAQSQSHTSLSSFFGLTSSNPVRQSSTGHDSPVSGHPGHHAHGSISRSASNLFHTEQTFQYPCDSENYDVISEIGIGAFATVYRAVCKTNNEEVAIKVIDLDQFNTNWEEIRNEILIMSQLHHPNVVKIKTSFVDKQELWIVMPLLHAGSCASLMKQFYPTGFKDEVLLATILRDTLQGLLYLHKDNRIHRDLKAGNVLIGKTGEVELADFGVAGTLMENGDRVRNRQTFTGTPCWMAPEVMEHTTGYDQHADIWSFGITAMELAYGRAPYARFQPMKVMLLTLQEPPPTCEIYKDNAYTFSQHFHSMISKCLRKDPKARPNARKLLEHKFFKQARDNKYIVEKIVSKLPKDVALSERRVHICKEKTLHDADREMKSKPISINGSWNFGSEGVAGLKRQAEEEERLEQELNEKERKSSHLAAVDASYHEEESPYVGGPVSSPHSPISPTSPHEHREGRFVVSDEEGAEGHDVVNNSHVNAPTEVQYSENIGLNDQMNTAHLHYDDKHFYGVNEDLAQQHVGRFSIQDE